MTETFRRKRKSSQTILEAKFAAQKLAFAPISFQAAKALRDLGILAEIDKAEKSGISAAEISKRLKISQYGVETLLEVGVNIDLVKQVSKKYSLTKVGFFILHDEMTRVNMNFTADVCYHGSAFMQESIKLEKPIGLKVFGDWDTIYEGLSQLPVDVQKSWFDFDHYYSDLAFGDALKIVFKDAPKNLFDIGGNTGKWARQCLQFNADVTVTILDLPGQLNKAKENLQKLNLDKRTVFCEIDLLSETAKIPAGADAIWMSQFLDCFSKAQIVDILKKAAAALEKGGSIYILEPFWDKQKFPASTFSLNHTSLYFTCLANGNSKMYSFDEMVECVEQAGLKVEEPFFGVGENDYTLLKCSK